MTAIFDFIGLQIDIAKDDNNIKILLVDVFNFITSSEIGKSNLYNSDHYPEWWYYREFNKRKQREEFSLGDWDDYFSYLHDIDHATDHRVFRPRVDRAIHQLEKLLEYEAIVKKYDLATLFKYCPEAEKYFLSNFRKASGLWARIGSTFDIRDKEAKKDE